MSEPLAIIGIGCLFPKAGGVGAYWANIKNRVDGIGPIPPTHWSPSDYFDADPKRPDFTYAQRGGFIDPIPFNPAEWGIAPNDLEATDTSQLLALVVAQMALRDAGVSVVRGPSSVATDHAQRTTDSSRVSVILGVTGTLEMVVPLGARLGHPHWRKALQDTGVEADVADDVIRRIGERYVGWQENSFPGLLGNVVAGRVANRLDLGGTNCVVDAACASSLSALHLAGMELQTGKADVVVTGGVDTFNDIFMYMCFSKTPALSPTGDAKPFDATGDGTILGEGLGIVVLKRLADAERDGNRIYAVVKGIGTSSDGKGNAIYAPSSAGQVEALRSAYSQANVTPDTIELIEAHGTGTKVGDAAEVQALTSVFRDASKKRSPWCALGSVKSQIGHTKAAAGAAGLIKAVLALHHKVLPPTIKVKQPLDALASGSTPFYVNAEPRPWLANDSHPRRAAVSAFGFGGSNFHCVLEEHTGSQPGPDWDGDVQIVALSASTVDVLKNQITDWENALKPTRGGGWVETRARAATARSDFRPEHPHRLLFIITRNQDNAALAARARQLLDTNAGRSTWHTPDGIAHGSGQPTGKIGFLFPGQGSQSVGMLRDLACAFPVMQQVLTEANRAFAAGFVEAGEKRLSDYVYPHSAFTPDARATQEDALRATSVAQPALGAVSLGALHVLAEFGVKPDAAAGHSYGELTALCAAGCFDAPSLFELSQLRGRLMAASGADAGAMLAVQAPMETVEELLATDALDLVIANRNAPAQAVLSGRTTEIERATIRLKAQQVRHVRLPVAAAFHSPLVADAAGPFRAALAPIPFHTAQLPVYANSTGREYPRDPQQVRDILAGQLARPVEFVDQIRNMAAAGVRTFVEVGPGFTLTKLVESILEGQPHQSIALDASAGKRSGMIDLAMTLSRLAALGYPVRLAAWDAGAPPASPQSDKPTLTVPICGANYRKPRTESAPSRKLKAVELAMPNDSLNQALKTTQESLAAFQRMQEQTALLHRQFLETQETAQKTLQTLVEGQQRLLSASLGLPAPAMPMIAAPIHSPPPRLAAPLPPPLVQRVEAPAPKPAPKLQSVATGLSPEHVQRVLLAVVAEKTGYPPEMINPDMGLDADLGIDSIKRVEILSALQEQLPDAPAVKPEHLGTLHTLRQIVEFLCAGERGASATGVESKTPVAHAHARGSFALSSDRVMPILLGIVAEKTGYPPEMINADMGLDADLGIDSIKRVEILSALQEQLPEAPAVKPEHLGTLHTLRQIAEFLCAGEPGASATGVESKTPVANAPGSPKALTRYVLRAVPLNDGLRPPVALDAGAEILLVGDDDPLTAALSQRLTGRGFRISTTRWAEVPTNPVTNVGGLVLIAGDNKTIDAFRLLRQVRTGLFATVTRLDGAIGLSERGPVANAETGALAGLVKTLRRERPDVAVKAIDIDPKLDPDIAAEAIADELLLSGPIEVGIGSDGRRTLELASAPLESAALTPTFSPSDVIVLTGGARGVTAATAIALAEAGRPRIILLGRSPEPSAELTELAACVDEPSIKRAMAMKSPGATPRQLDEQCKSILAGREIRHTLERIAATGAQARYYSVDVRNFAALVDVLSEVRRSIGPITGIVHGAGVLADRRIEDQTDEQFELVYSTKVAGLNCLLSATANDPLKLLALFSSSTGRFGRSGQVAYAAANEALNKLAQAESRRRQDCRVVAVNWGPWEGGMVSPGLRSVFAAEGISLIPLEAGARHLLAEIAAPDRAVETVVLGAGSKVPSDAPPQRPAVDEAPALLGFERELDLDRHPILRAHVIDGRAVLPMALTIEWLAHAALHGNPGLAFHGLDELRIFQPVTVREGRSTTIRIHAAKAIRRDGLHQISAEIRGQRDGKEIVYSRGTVVLGAEVPSALPASSIPVLPPYSLDTDDVYQRVLFHGPELRGIEAILGCGSDGIVVTAATAPPPSAWVQQPQRGAWLADPLALDCAFQAMSVWCRSERGAVSLPSAFAQYRQFVRRFPGPALRVVCRVKAGAGQVVRADIEFLDESGKLIASIDGYECVLDPALNAAFRRNRLERAGV